MPLSVTKKHKGGIFFTTWLTATLVLGRKPKPIANDLQTQKDGMIQWMKNDLKIV